MTTSRIDRLTHLFTEKFSPSHLDIVDESPHHGASLGDATHLHILLISSHFSNKSRVQRHQQVYTLLSPEMEQGLHAITLNLFTPDEWAARQGQKLGSPVCQGHH